MMENSRYFGGHRQLDSWVATSRSHSFSTFRDCREDQVAGSEWMDMAHLKERHSSNRAPSYWAESEVSISGALTCPSGSLVITLEAWA